MYFVYFNLHKKCWSCKNIKTGLVEMHVNEIFLENVQFKVSESGRQRVLREKRKNVHAGVVGTVSNKKQIKNKIEVIYNPYLYKTFVIKNTNTPIYNAKLVHMINGRVFIGEK
jgi:hypothetical protein